MAVSHGAISAWVVDWVADFSRRSEFDRFIAWVDWAIAAEVPVVLEDPELKRDLDASSRGQARAFLASLTSQPDAVVPVEALGLARTMARRGIDLQQLLRIYRVGHRAAHQYLADQVESRPTEPALKSAVLVHLLSRTTDWLDASVELLSITYADERQRWTHGAAARRADGVYAILRGDQIGLDEASVLLGYALRRVHTALVLWRDEPAPRATAAVQLQTLADHAAGALDLADPLIMRSGERGLWAWLGSDREPELGVLADPAALRQGEGLWVAVGTPRYGLDGFRRSHAEAVAAQRVAIDGRRQEKITFYADVELVSMLSGDRDAMQAFVVRELRGLADPGASYERIRETTLAFLIGGAARAARELNIHRNTVRYRIHQAESLLGHSIQDRRAQVELALRCVEVFGPSAPAKSGRVVPGAQIR